MVIFSQKGPLQGQGCQGNVLSNRPQRPAIIMTVIIAITLGTTRLHIRRVVLMDGSSESPREPSCPHSCCLSFVSLTSAFCKHNTPRGAFPGDPDLWHP